MTNGVFILLGSNKGDRLRYLALARETIDTTVGKIIRQSSIYETAAWGKTDQSDFLNQVIEIDTSNAPSMLLSQLLALEIALGRHRTEPWAAREIDLDILFYNQLIIETKTLTVPHPQIPSRRFTLMPLVEIASPFIHPVLKKTCRQLLEECTDALAVNKFL